MLGSQVESEASQYRYLCTTAPFACEYAPATAPVLNADVCYGQNTITLMGPGGCSSSEFAAWVKTGEVIDPNTNEVLAYIPLDDACDRGYCLSKAPGDPPGEPGAMCCDPSSGGCFETSAICPPDQIAVWCPDGQIATEGEDGDWECSEG
ncbi:hypothetical protein DB30_03318 [Enhygromyxa salina]|uniref:Uncharacterized protein n=1 Tax=Enhygromyxa salina TaxID=215803 RepID=A0A0C1ZIN3_9BACT|nr:hypothetical protein [Enhygromyxa salina]KIG17399.1 hypothetical protein DB30_03318 [Enhygromyxa salina]